MAGDGEKNMRIGFVIVSLIALVTVAPSLGETPLGTAFTYQGQLKQAGAPFEGTADFQFTLWDAAGSGNPPTGGVQVGGVQAINALPVTAGLFTVTLNGGGEFGGNAFNGNARWVQVAVRVLVGGGAFTTLAPRQPLTAAPQALFALSVRGGVSGSGTVNSIPFWSAGTTLGNSQITQSANGVQLPNGVQLGVGAQGNQVSFGSPNGETGMSIAGATGRADVRFDGTTLRLFNGPAGTPPANGIAINASGKVGIGTASPLSKLDIAATGEGAELLRFSTERPWVFRQVRTGPSAGLQLRSTGGLKAFEITANDENNVATFVADSVSSRVGIGTTDPAAKLHVVGGTPVTPSAGGFIQLGSSTGTNVAIDDDEIMARYNGAPTNLYVNYDGGDVVFGGAIDIGYEIVVANLQDALCPAGKKVLGGGCGTSGGAYLREGRPLNNGWHCELADCTNFCSIDSYAICARVK